ncbi:MAG: glutamate dehydrogenase, partial [Roseinatronobacter sp.]
DVAKTGLTGDLAGKRIIVQGLGNVGYHAAKFLREEDDALIIGIIERDGALINDKGMDPDAVRDWIAQTGGVKGFEGAEYVENGPVILEAECDILIPAALEGVININNASRIRAPLIIEAANGPITASADEVLREKEIIIIPDLYANAGGVTVSYFEWVKNLSHIRFGRMQRRNEEAHALTLVRELERLSADKNLGWELSPNFKRRYLQGADELQLVRSGLDDTMRTAYQSISEEWHRRPDVKDLRTAAFIVAIERVAASYRAKGL